MTTQTVSKSRRSSGAGTFRVVATNAAYGKLCQRSLNRLPARFRDRIDLQKFSNLEDVSLPQAKAAWTVFVSRLADFPEEGAKRALRAGSDWKHLLFVDSLPVEAMPARLLQLDIRKSQRLHVAAERSPDLIAALIYRLFSGLTHADGPQSIVDAWVEGENLVFLSPTFERLTVPLKKLAKLIGTDAGEIEAFEIDEDGRFIFWPHADVHLGWEQFLQITDPAAALVGKQKSEAFNKRYGAAIRAFREEHDLKQADVGGVTERHLRRVEHGELAASKSTLEALADAHGLGLEDYLKKVAQRVQHST